jgi:PAS domain-containing protein
MHFRKRFGELMTLSLRRVDNESEVRVASAEVPLFRPPHTRLSRQAAHFGRTNRVEEFIEQVFAGFLEVTPDAVVVADEEGRIIRVNGQTEAGNDKLRAEDKFGQAVDKAEKFVRKAAHRVAESVFRVNG